MVSEGPRIRRVEEDLVVNNQATSPNEGSMLHDAVKRLQHAVRCHVLRHRQPSWFELDHRTLVHSRFRRTTCSGRRSAALGCTFLLFLAAYWTVVISNLLTNASEGGCEGSCIQGLWVAGFCDSNLRIAAHLNWRWHAWSTVQITNLRAELRAYNDSGVMLAHSLLPSMTLANGLNSLRLNMYALISPKYCCSTNQHLLACSSIELAPPSTGAAPLFAFLSAGNVSLIISGHANVGVPAVTGPFPITIKVPYSLRFDCSNYSCATAGRSLAPSAVEPATSSRELSFGAIVVDSPAGTAMRFSTHVRYNRTSIPLFASLPPLAVSIDDLEASGGLRAASIIFDEATIENGHVAVWARLQLSASSRAEGKMLTTISHSLLACFREEPSCTQDEELALYAYIGDTLSGSALHASCYLQMLLAEMRPLPLSAAVGRYTSVPAVPEREKGVASMFRKQIVELAAANLMEDEMSVQLQSTSILTHPLVISGRLPSMEVSLLWASAASSGKPLAVLQLEDIRTGEDLLEDRAVLEEHPPGARNPPDSAVATRLALSISSKAVHVASQLLRPVVAPNITHLAHLLSLLSIGAPPTSHDGIAQLRVPLIWMVAPEQLPAYAPLVTLPPFMEDVGTTGMAAAIEMVDIDARYVAHARDHQGELMVAASLGTSISTSGIMPHFMVLKAGAINGSVACNASSVMSDIWVSPVSLQGDYGTRATLSTSFALSELTSAIVGNSASPRCDALLFNASLCSEPSSCGLLTVSAAAAKGFARAWALADGGRNNSKQFADRPRINISVEEVAATADHKNASSAIILHVLLPMETPANIMLPPLNLSLRSNDEHGMLMASLTVHEFCLTTNGGFRAHVELLLSEAHRKALGGTLSGLLRGQAQRILIVGSAAGDTRSMVRVSVNATLPLPGSNASSTRWMQTPSLDIVGPTNVTLPCVWDMWICPLWSRHDLEALPSTSFGLRASIPVPRALLSPHAPLLWLHIPHATELALGVNWYRSIVTMRVPSLTFDNRNSSSLSSFEVVFDIKVLDWYAVSRVSSGVGRSQGVELPPQTVHLGGLLANSSWSRSLPELNIKWQPVHHDNVSFNPIVTMPTPFNCDAPPCTAAPITLASTTPTGVTFQLPVVTDFSIPFSLELRESTLSVLFSPPYGSSPVKVLDITSKSRHPLRLQSGKVEMILHATLHATDGSNGSCVRPLCYASSSASRCDMCALGFLMERLTAANRTVLDVRLAFKNENGEPVNIELSMTANDDQTQVADSYATFAKRDTLFFADLRARREHPTPMGDLFDNRLDMFGSIEDSILSGGVSDRLA